MKHASTRYAGVWDSGCVHEECGVFGIWTPEGSGLSPAHESYAALFALQHRGQEACGIAVNNRGVIQIGRASCRERVSFGV